MTIDGKARTAAASAARTRTKHERWIAELAGAGWSVIRAGDITFLVDQFTSIEVTLSARCGRCGEVFARWGDPGCRWLETPLPRVLHAVSGHTCTEGGS